MGCLSSCEVSDSTARLLLQGMIQPSRHRRPLCYDPSLAGLARWLEPGSAPRCWASFQSGTATRVLRLRNWPPETTVSCTDHPTRTLQQLPPSEWTSLDINTPKTRTVSLSTLCEHQVSQNTLLSLRNLHLLPLLYRQLQSLY